MSDAAEYRNALAIGTELMEYRLDAVLGTGGFGLTYLAWDAHLEKQVAIKEYLPADFALRALDGSVVPVATQRENDYRWGLERFLQEARTLARFGHPHIVRVKRYFEANNTAYMVMEYERGESLNALLKREPRPAEEKLRAMLLPLLDGLRAVHEAGFLHRDIKPSNLFLRQEDGSPVLLDFGAARYAIGHAGGRTAVVTAGYAPIEQYAAGAQQGPWSDIYALGGVVFRAVTDANPPDAVSRLRDDGVPQMLAAARDRYSERFLRAIGWALLMDEGMRPQSVADWQGAVAGKAAIPFDLPSRGLVRAPIELGTSAKVEAQRRYPRWLAPALAVLAALNVVRAFEGRVESPSPTPVVLAPAAPAAQAGPAAQPAPVVAQAPPSAPKQDAAHAHPARKAGARHFDTVRSAPGTEADDDSFDVPVIEAGPVRDATPLRHAAPVRDAVALPPLTMSRDRPGRDRTPRP
jgi:hypothetical protein